MLPSVIGRNGSVGGIVIGCVALAALKSRVIASPACPQSSIGLCPQSVPDSGPEDVDQANGGDTVGDDRVGEHRIERDAGRSVEPPV
jgi:hypothetical protein